MGKKQVKHQRMDNMANISNLYLYMTHAFEVVDDKELFTIIQRAYPVLNNIEALEILEMCKKDRSAYQYTLVQNAILFKFLDRDQKRYNASNDVL